MDVCKINDPILKNLMVEIISRISKYKKKSFVCFFSDYIRHNTIRGHGFSDYFKSKYKDSIFLIALRLSIESEGSEDLFISKENEENLSEIGKCIQVMVKNYLSKNYDLHFSFNSSKIRKKIVHEYTFANYYQNGILNYKEQEINYIINLFHPYRDVIKKRLEIDFYDLIAMCDYSEELYKRKAISNQIFHKDKGFQIAIKKLISGKINQVEFEIEIEKLPINISESFISFVDAPHESLIFRKEDFYSNFDKVKVDIFCELFSLNINDKLLYEKYIDENPFESKPILKLNKVEYLNVFQKQLPNSLYKVLYNIVGSTEKEKTKLNYRRGKVTFEQHIIKICEVFFKHAKGFKIYSNYYLEGQNDEKDILILVNRYAFVIECKSTSFRKPTEETEQAFQRIENDFKKCIQKGYDQCITVEQALIEKDNIILEINKRKEKVSLNTTNLVDVFSIIVTSERFGIIQNNLNLLLKIKKTDPYPWSVYVDDFEVFLKALAHMYNNPLRRFIDYISLREELNGYVYGNDELDICAMYMKSNTSFRKLVKSKVMFEPLPELQNYFDKLYFSGKIKF